MEGNWAAPRVRRNFRIDLFSAVLSGLYISVLVTFMPVVVRRLGGSPSDVALVIAAPFIGHLLAPVFAYLLAGIPVVRVVAGTTTLARVVLIVGVLVAATPLMLAVTTVVFFVITVANVAAYTALMQGIYPDRERAQAMANVRVGASIAGIASAALAGAFIDIIPAAYVFAAATALALPGAVAFFWVRYQGPPVPVAVVSGITVAGGEITFYTNVVQLAPRERVAEYAAAQSLLLGLRGTAAPFIASGLLASVEPKAVLVTGMFFMVAGCAIFAGALREPKAAVAPILTPATQTAETAP